MGTLNLGSSGTITNLAVGGVPDNTIDNGTLADDSVGLAELSATGTASSSTFLRGDNAWATLPASGGPLVYDEWRITTNFYTGYWNGDGQSGRLRYNFERSDNETFEQIGTGFSAPPTGTGDLAGAWTFPSTGWWEIQYKCTMYIPNDISTYNFANIYWTEDNGSNWTNEADGTNHLADTNSNAWDEINVSLFTKVTDLTNQKFYLRWYAYNYGNGDTYITGSTDVWRTGVRMYKWLEI